MAFNLIASGGASGVNSATTSGTNTTGANFIILGVTWSNGTTPTISDSKSNSWTKLTEQVGDFNTVAFWYSYPTSVGTSHTFTASASGLYPYISFAAFSGIKASGFDVQNGAIGSGVPSISTGNITPSVNNSLVITYVGSESSPSLRSVSNGFGALNIVGTTGLFYQLQGTAAAIGATFGYSADTYSALAIASFKLDSTVSVLPVDIAVVGAGGGGGAGGGAGAGGGGVVLSGSTKYAIAVGSWAVTVGAGGAAGTGQYAGGYGSNSSILSVVGGGGGAGAGGVYGPSSAYYGSGGGMGAFNTGSGYAAGGSASYFVYGAARNGGGNDGYTSSSGGGGGATAVGNDAGAGAAGNGGQGSSSSISGSSVVYGSGGGGGSNQDTGVNPGSGGTNAGSGVNYAVGSGGSANKGGGGGGGGWDNAGNYYSGGAGGSGVVIISYATSAATGLNVTGGTKTTNGSNTIHTFTSTGTFAITIPTPVGMFMCL